MYKPLYYQIDLYAIYIDFHLLYSERRCMEQYDSGFLTFLGCFCSLQAIRFNHFAVNNVSLKYTKKLYCIACGN